MATQRRHLLLTIRKAKYCRCGCGGWCTLRPMYAFLHWCFVALSNGVHPSNRYDGGEFKDGDERLRSLAGTPCPRAAVLFLKADLAELGTPLGFPTTATSSDPCFLCRCTRDRLVQFDGWDCLSTPWPEKSFDDYIAACERCEMWRTVSKEEHAILKVLVEYDRRKSLGASRGIALTCDVPRLNLLKGDRIEAHHGMPDIATFFEISSFPARILFWRRSQESMARRRNPLFSEETGLTPQRCAALDWLHGLSLGCFQTYCAFTVHTLLKADAYSTEQTNMSARAAVSIELMSKDLIAWQRLEKGLGRSVTEVSLKP